jgi:type II protein arginine methyltransferase
LARAGACRRQYDFSQAEKLTRQVLARDPRHPAALAELGHIAYATGNRRAAADCLRSATGAAPNDAGLYNELACVLIALGERQEALRALSRAREIKPDDADILSNIGSFYLGDGRISEAVTEYRRALKIDPDHFKARLNLEMALKKAVAPWHFPMMNDSLRNSLYAEAIRRVVPGRSVLDIGTGAGLLAMMAARAGARWVASCEQAPWIAAKAKEVIAANGLSDRIRLIAKRSTDLNIGQDLEERAEVLVSEVFGTSVINELVIPTVTHAHAQLLQRGAKVIPRAASARAYLAAGAALEGNLFVDRAADFTLAPFNDFAPSKLGLDAGFIPHEAISEDFEVFQFDLERPPPASQRRRIEITATRPGRCFGLVQWLRIHLAEDLFYENRPGSAAINGWGHMLYRFAQPRDLAAGDCVRLVAQHNADTLLIWEQKPVVGC